MPEAKGRKRKLSPPKSGDTQGGSHAEKKQDYSPDESNDEPEFGVPVKAEGNTPIGAHASANGAVHSECESTDDQNAEEPSVISSSVPKQHPSASDNHQNSSPALLLSDSEPEKTDKGTPATKPMAQLSGQSQNLIPVPTSIPLETTLTTLLASQDQIIQDQAALAERLGRMESTMLDSLNRLTKVLENVTSPRLSAPAAGMVQGREVVAGESTRDKSKDHSAAASVQMPSLTSASLPSRGERQSGTPHHQDSPSLPVIVNSGSTNRVLSSNRHSQNLAISTSALSNLSKPHYTEPFSPQCAGSSELESESPVNTIQSQPHSDNPSQQQQQQYATYPTVRQSNQRQQQHRLSQLPTLQQFSNTGNGGIPELLRRIQSSTAQHQQQQQQQQQQRNNGMPNNYNNALSSVNISSSPYHSADSPQLITDDGDDDYSVSPTDQDDVDSSNIIMEMLRGRTDRVAGANSNQQHSHNLRQHLTAPKQLQLQQQKHHQQQQQSFSRSTTNAPAALSGANNAADQLLDYGQLEQDPSTPAYQASSNPTNGNPTRPGEPVIGNVRNVLPPEFLRPVTAAASRTSSAMSSTKPSTVVKLEPAGYGFGGEDDSMMENDQDSEADAGMDTNYFNSADSWLSQAFLQSGAARASPTMVGTPNSSANVSFNRQRNSVQQKIVDLLYNSGMDFTTYSNTRKWINNKLRELCGGNETIIAYSYLGEGGPSRSRTKYADCGEIICHPLTCLGDLNDAGLADPTHSDGYITIAQNPILLKDILVKTISNARQKLFAKFGPLKRTRDEEEQHLRARGASLNQNGDVVTINTTITNGLEGAGGDPEASGDC